MARRNDAHFVPDFLQPLRERSGNVREAPHLREGVDFR
jgi:hypothetical protein